MTILELLELVVHITTDPKIKGSLSTILFLIFIGSVLLEFSKLKFSPWTWTFKRLGKIMNSEIYDQLETVNKRLTHIEKRQDDAEHQDKLEKAMSARRRILKANNDLIRGFELDREYMRNLMHDITEYEEYCDKHADPNDPWHFSNRECPEAIESLTKYNHELEVKLREKNKKDA